VHPLCASGARQTVTIAAHHAGIPLNLAGLSGKAKILVQAEHSSLPEVEVRPLRTYELCAQSSVVPCEPAELTESTEWEVRHEQ
jgi:hypothetical protein